MADVLPLPAEARRRRIRPLLGSLSYVRHGRARCFVCATVDGEPGYEHRLIYRDADAIAFLSKWPPIWGHVLVAPTRHREHVVGDFDVDEYARLQAVVHRVGAAVSRSVPCERLYVLSLGSQQLNRHVHWHVAPLPPGVRLSRQQFRAFSRVFAGEIDCSDSCWDQLADRIRYELDAPD